MYLCMYVCMYVCKRVKYYNLPLLVPFTKSVLCARVWVGEGQEFLIKKFGYMHLLVLGS